MLCLGLVLFFGTTACSRDAEAPSSDTAAGTSPDSSTAVVSFPVDIQGVNELTTNLTSIQTALLYFALFMPLLEEQPDYATGPPTFKPRLAESFEFSEDHLQLTFKLREGMTWSDGVPVTAEDVLFTYEAQISPEVAWNYRDSKDRITKVEVLDPLTVRFHFDGVYATQLLDVNQGVILPKHAWEKLPFSDWRTKPRWFLDHLVVNGPFTLEDWDPGQSFALRRNDRYFEPGLPKIDRLVFLITPDPSTQIAQLRSGQVHLAEWIRPGSASIITEHPDLELLSYSTRQYVFVSWNTMRPYFAEQSVRQALAMAIDRQAIIDTLYFGYATLSKSPFVTNTWVHHRDIEPWPYDPEKARQMLAEAGWEDSDGDGILDKDGTPFRFEILTNSDNDIRRDILIMIQEQLKRVGVDAQPRTLEFNTLTKREMAHEYDASLASMSVDTSLNLSYLFHTKAIEDGYNWGVFSDPEVDRVLEELEKQADFQDAKPLYYRIQELLHEHQPIAFLYEPLRLCAVNKRLKNVAPNEISTFHNIRAWELAGD